MTDGDRIGSTEPNAKDMVKGISPASDSFFQVHINEICMDAQSREALARLSPAEMQSVATSIMDDIRQKLELPTSVRECIGAHFLITILEERGVPPEALDDLVLDCTGAEAANLANETGDEVEQEDAIAVAESKGANINNDGLACQINYLVSCYGSGTATDMVLMAAQKWLAQSGPKAR